MRSQFMMLIPNFSRTTMTLGKPHLLSFGVQRDDAESENQALGRAVHIYFGEQACIAKVLHKSSNPRHKTSLAPHGSLCHGWRYQE